MKYKSKNASISKTNEPCRHMKHGEKGITLIALVVTIVVLLILAGVSINLIFSNDGIIKKAQQVADAQKEAIEKDKQEIEALGAELNRILEGSTENQKESAYSRFMNFDFNAANSAESLENFESVCTNYPFEGATAVDSCMSFVRNEDLTFSITGAVDFEIAYYDFSIGVMCKDSSGNEHLHFITERIEEVAGEYETSIRDYPIMDTCFFEELDSETGYISQSVDYLGNYLYTLEGLTFYALPLNGLNNCLYTDCTIDGGMAFASYYLLSAYDSDGNYILGLEVDLTK